MLLGLLALSSFSCNQAMYTLLSLSLSLFRCLAGLATYFIAGILVMKFVKGATGKELIPNYAFWSDLPHLIKVLHYMIIVLELVYILLIFIP